MNSWGKSDRTAVKTDHEVDDYIDIGKGDFIGCAFVSWHQSESHKTGKLQYEVTIDDIVSMTEFNKKYEIIEQRGDIFVVKEREQ